MDISHPDISHSSYFAVKKISIPQKMTKKVHGLKDIYGKVTNPMNSPSKSQERVIFFFIQGKLVLQNQN